MFQDAYDAAFWKTFAPNEMVISLPAPVPGGRRTDDPEPKRGRRCLNIIIVSHGDLLSVFNSMFLGLEVESLNACEMFGFAGGVSQMIVRDDGKRMIKRIRYNKLRKFQKKKTQSADSGRMKLLYKTFERSADYVRENCNTE